MGWATGLGMGRVSARGTLQGIGGGKKMMLTAANDAGVATSTMVLQTDSQTYRGENKKFTVVDRFRKPTRILQKPLLPDL